MAFIDGKGNHLMFAVMGEIKMDHLGKAAHPEYDNFTHRFPRLVLKMVRQRNLERH